MKNNKFYTSNSINELEIAQRELVTAGSNLESFLAWGDTCKLTFYDLNDKAKQYPKNINQVLDEYRTEFGHRLTATEACQLLQFYIDSKNDYKASQLDKKKLLVTSGPKYTKEYLEDEHKAVQIRDELLHINSKDINLFQNFKLCGDQLCLIEGTDVELLEEDKYGKVMIDNRLFIKGNIAERVQFIFMTKIGTYYKQLANFLATLDVENIVMDLDNSIVETPIEDFIQTEMPTKFMLYYRIEAVFQKWTDKDNKTRRKLDHFELIRNPKIESFDDIFDYTLENWSKFRRCIQGQTDFLAWANDPSKIAVSHWVTEEVNVLPEPWKEFLDEKMPRHLQMRLVAYLGMCIDEHNSAQQYLIISDNGGTGKGVMMRALESVMPPSAFGTLNEGDLSDKSEFGFSGTKIWNNHISVIEEYKSGTLTSNRAKMLIANNPMSLNSKNRRHVKWNPLNHKLIVFSNEGATIKDWANRRRAIPVTFTGDYEWTKEKQDALNSTAKDFLNFCYTAYKKCPLIVNGAYMVLSEEHEKRFLEGTLEIKNKDILSKAAFSEECLKEYYRTDEYENTEDYIDYHNLFEELFVEDANGYVPAKDMQRIILDFISSDEKRYNEYSSAVGIIKKAGEYELDLHNKQYWKWTSYLKTKRNAKSKTIRVNGKACSTWGGIALKKSEDKEDFI